MSSMAHDHRTKAVAVAVGAALLIRLGYSWLSPKPIPTIPHNPITSIWGDIPAFITANKEEKKSFADFLSDMSKIHGPIFQILLGRQAWVVLADKAEMKRILVENKITEQRGRVRQMFGVVIPNAQISLLTDEKWKRHRRVTGPSMSRRYLERMSTRIAAGANSLVRLWNAKLDMVGSCSFEAGLDIHLATTDTIVSITMGSPLDCTGSVHAALMLGEVRKDGRIAHLPHPQLPPLYTAIGIMMESIDKVSKAAFPPLSALMFRHASPSWRKQYELIRSYINDAIIEAREREDMSGGKGGSLGADADYVLDMIIRHEARGGAEKFEKSEIIDELLMYVIAGQDTTASTLKWLVKFLPTDAEIQRRLHEEMCSVFGQGESTSTSLDFNLLDDPTRVPILEAVVAETLRCGGPAPLTAKELLQDETILGKFVPKGTDMIFAAAVMSRDESDWGPDANEWRPSRWITASGAFDRSAGPSFPFGLGLRSCFGQRLALLELKYFVATMSRSFFFKAVPPEVNSWEAAESVASQPKICHVLLEKWNSTPTE